MKKKSNWVRLEESAGNGLHLPAGETDRGLFNSSSQIHKLVGFVNSETGEIKIFSKKFANEIGISNLGNYPLRPR